MAKMSKTKKKKIRRIILLVIATVILGALLFLSPKIITVTKLYNEAKSYARNSTVSTFKDSETTIIYDTYGNQLCTMKNEKDLYYVEADKIPKTLQNAFIVMEDRGFYNHGGIDFKAIVRAVIVNQKSNEIEQGASTITQQLARNIFLSQEVTWERKIEEMFLAQELEKIYSKEQILEFYLNNIYFGNGYYGVEAAARGYFNKSVSELSLSQQAFIASIPNNPSRYDPFSNLNDVVSRRNLILNEMYSNDYINSMYYYSATAEEIVLEQPQAEIRNNSVETYARHCATESLMQSSGFVFRYNFETDKDYEVYMDRYYTYYTQSQQKLLSGGYQIYTSIDMDIQDKLQSSIDDNLKGNQSKSEDGVYELQSAATCIDNSTGNVVAIVGSRSQELAGLTLNRAYQSYRQPGSSIKPISVYTPYLQHGKTPDSIVIDAPIADGPKNADGTFSGAMTLRDAVKWSKNTVAWNIYQEIGTKAGCTFLLNMGFHKVWMDKEFNAAALGGFTYGVSPEEMAGAYAAIVNDGVYRRTTCIKTIVDSSGKTVTDEETRTNVRVYDINSCRMMTDMLKTVVTSGTGTNANIDNGIVAGKTGTTNDDKDAWFCGYSRYYTTSVWIGYDMPKTLSNGGYYATSIWRDFMKSVHTELPKLDFIPYTNVIEQETTTAQKVTEETTEITQTSATENETTASSTSTTTAPSNGNGENNNGSSGNASSGDNSQSTENISYPQGDWDAQTQTDADANGSGGDW